MLLFLPLSAKPNYKRAKVTAKDVWANYSASNTRNVATTGVTCREQCDLCNEFFLLFN